MFEPFSYLAATTRGLADANPPGAADDGLPSPRPWSRASRFGWVGLLGFLCNAVCLPLALLEALS